MYIILAREERFSPGKRTRNDVPFGKDVAHLLVHAGEDVTLIESNSSAGLLLSGDWQTVTITQDLVFTNTATATLDKSDIAIDSVLWLGNDLGELTEGAFIMESK